MRTSIDTTQVSMSIVCYIVTALAVGYMYMMPKGGFFGDYDDLTFMHYLVIFSTGISGLTFYLSRGFRASFAAICLTLNLTILLILVVLAQ